MVARLLVSIAAKNGVAVKRRPRLQQRPSGRTPVVRAERDTPYRTDPRASAIARWRFCGGRIRMASVTPHRHMFEFVVPMVPPNWNTAATVRDYEQLLVDSDAPTAAVSLDIVQPAPEAADQTDYFEHWCLIHFLLDATTRWRLLPRAAGRSARCGWSPSTTASPPRRGPPRPQAAVATRTTAPHASS